MALTKKDGSSKLSTLWIELRQYIDLNVEYAKLTAAEKLTVLFTTVALALVIGVLFTLIFFFISIAAVHWLAAAGMSVALAYSIMAGFYIVVAVLLFILRKQLLVDPVARFISKLLLK